MVSSSFNRVPFGRKGLSPAISLPDQNSVFLDDLRSFTFTFVAGFVFFSLFFG